MCWRGAWSSNLGLFKSNNVNTVPDLHPLQGAGGCIILCTIRPHVFFGRCRISRCSKVVPGVRFSDRRIADNAVLSDYQNSDLHLGWFPTV